ncbi:MAG: hypothetical protein GY729_08655, partial [Desulfobacteraceae bacterium]|nr:hypothetical protein [Desulfobacteraceae bacterium]
MPLVTFIAYEGCMYSGALGMKDTFQIANLWAKNLKTQRYAPVFSFETASIDGTPIEADKNLLIRPDVSLEEARDSKVIVLPAFLPQENPLPDDVHRIADWL